jgi:hypothetical protein
LPPHAPGRRRLLRNADRTIFEVDAMPIAPAQG